MEALITNTQEAPNVKTYRAAKVAVTNQDGHLLLLWRSLTDSHRPGGVDFPGGEIEPGESPVEAAVRETRQETGLTLCANGLYRVGRFVKHVDEPDNWTKTVESTMFIGHAEDQEIALGRDGEHYAWEWMPPKVILEQDILKGATSKLATLITVIRMQERGAWPAIDR